MRRLGTDAVRDDIELLAILKEPGEIVIEVGGRRWTMPASIGLTAMKAPLSPGRPRFMLMRRGSVVLDFLSDWTVNGSADRETALYVGGVSSRL